MKTIFKNILFLVLVLIIGCSITNGSTRTDSNSNNPNQSQNNGVIDGKIKPFVDKTIKDETINVGIPVYKF